MHARPLHRIHGGLGEPEGHTNRVFSIKCHPSDPNIVFSGGWDNTVQVCLEFFSAIEFQYIGVHVCVCVYVLNTVGNVFHLVALDQSALTSTCKR